MKFTRPSGKEQANVQSDAIFEVAGGKTLTWENYTLNVEAGKSLTIQKDGSDNGNRTVNAENLTLASGSVLEVKAGVDVTFTNGITGSQGIVKMAGGSSMTLDETSTLGTLELPSEGSTITLQDDSCNVTIGTIRPAPGTSGKLTIGAGTGGTLNFAGQATGVTLVLNNSITYTGNLSIEVENGETLNGTNLEVGSAVTSLDDLTITLTGMLGKDDAWQGYKLFTPSPDSTLTQEQMTTFASSLRSDSYWRKCTVDQNGYVKLSNEYRDNLRVWKGATGGSWQEGGGNAWSTTPTGAASTAFTAGSDAVFLAQGNVSTQVVTVSGEVHAHDLVVGNPDDGSGAFYTFNGAGGESPDSIEISGDIIVSGRYGEGDASSPSQAVFNAPVSFTGTGSSITGAGTVEFKSDVSSAQRITVGEGMTVSVGIASNPAISFAEGITLAGETTKLVIDGTTAEGGTSAVDANTIASGHINSTASAGSDGHGTLVLKGVNGTSGAGTGLMNFLNDRLAWDASTDQQRKTPRSFKLIDTLELEGGTEATVGTDRLTKALTSIVTIKIGANSRLIAGSDTPFIQTASPAIEIASGGTLSIYDWNNNNTHGIRINSQVTITGDNAVINSGTETVGTATTLTLSGGLSMTGRTVRKTGVGILNLTGAITANANSKIDFQAGGLTLGSSFAGKVRIANGLTLTLGDGVSTGVEVGAGGEAELAINGYSGSVHSLSGGGKLVLSGSSKTLTFGTVDGEPASAYLDGSTTLELKSGWGYAGTLELRKGWQQGERIQLEEGMPGTAVQRLSIKVYVDFGGNTVADQLLLNDGQGVQVFGAVEDGIRGALEDRLTIEGQNDTLRVEISKDGYVKLARKGAANLTWDGGDDAVWRTRGTTRWSKGTDVFTENDHVAFEAQEGEVIVPVSGGVTPGSVTVKGGQYIFAPADEGASIVTGGEFSVENNAGIEIQLPATIGKLTGEGTLNVNSQGVVTINNAAFSGDIELEQGGLVLDGDWEEEAGKVGLKIGDARRVTLRGGYGNSLSEVRLADGNSTGVIYLDPGARWRLEDVEVQSGQDLTIGGGSSGKKGVVAFGSEGAPGDASGPGELSGGMLGLNAGQYSGNLGLKLSGSEANKGVKIRLGSGVTFSDLTLWIEVDEDAVESLKEGWSYQLFSKFGDDFNTQRANLKLKALEPELLREKGCKFSLLADGTVVVERERKRYWDGKNGPLLWGDATATPWTDGESDQGLLWDNGVTVHEVHFEGKDGGDHEVRLVQEKLTAEELHIDGAGSYTLSGNSSLELDRIVHSEGATASLQVGIDSAPEGQKTGMTVYGAATVGGSLTVGGSGEVSVGMNSEVGGSLVVSKGGQFKAGEGLSVGGDLEARGTVQLVDAKVGGGVTVAGSAGITGSLEAGGEVSVEKGAGLTVGVLTAQALDVQGTVSLNGGGQSEVTGEATLGVGSRLATTGELTVGALKAGTPAEPCGDLEVAENGKLTVREWSGSLSSLTLNNGTTLAIDSVSSSGESEGGGGTVQFGELTLNGRSDLMFSAPKNVADDLHLRVDAWEGEGSLTVHLAEEFLHNVAVAGGGDTGTYQLFVDGEEIKELDHRLGSGVQIADEAGYKIQLDREKGTITVEEIHPEVKDGSAYTSSKDNGGSSGTVWDKKNDENIYFDVFSYEEIRVDRNTTIQLTGEQRPKRAFGTIGLVLHNLQGSEAEATLSVVGGEGNDIVTLQDWEGVASENRFTYGGNLLLWDARLRIDHGRRNEQGDAPADRKEAVKVTSRLEGELTLRSDEGLDMCCGVLELGGKWNELGSGGISFEHGLEAQLTLLEGSNTRVAGEIRRGETLNPDDIPEGRKEHVRLEDGANLTLGAVSQDEEQPAPETVVREGIFIGHATATEEPAQPGEVSVQGKVAIEGGAHVTGVHLFLNGSADLTWQGPAEAEDEQDVVYGLDGAAGSKLSGDKQFSIRAAQGDSTCLGTDFSSYTGTMTVLGSEHSQRFVGVTGGDGWSMEVQGGGNVEFDLRNDEGGNVPLRMGGLTLQEAATMTLQFVMDETAQAPTEEQAEPVALADALPDELAAVGGGVASFETFRAEEGTKLVLSTTSFLSPAEEGTTTYTLGTVDNVAGSHIGVGETGILPELLGANFWHVDSARVYLRGNEILLEVKAAEKNKIAEALGPDASQNAKAGAEALWDVTMSQNGRIVHDLADPTSDLVRLAYGADSLMQAGNAKGLEKLMAGSVGASFVGVAPALGQDMHRQLTAIRNRTTSMGTEISRVDDAHDLPLWHAWINAESGYHELDDDGLQPGYRLNGWGGTVGMDADVSLTTTVGLALSAMYNDLKSGAADSMTSDLDTYYLSAFLRRMSGRWSHTLVLSVGTASLDSKRTVALTGGSYTANGDTDGYALGALYELGYTHGLSPEGSSALQSVFNVEFRRVSLSGFEEDGSAAALHVDDMEETVITFGAGLRYQRAVGTRAVNRSALLELRALAKVDAGDTQGEVVTNFLDASYQAHLRGAEIGRVGVELGAGVTVPIGNRSSIFADASLELRSGYTSFDAAVGYRINF